MAWFLRKPKGRMKRLIMRKPELQMNTSIFRNAGYVNQTLSLYKVVPSKKSHDVTVCGTAKVAEEF